MAIFSRSVKVGKIDLDTIGAAWILGVTPKDKVEFLPNGQASPEDLANPDVICIEVGADGEVELLNFDHHKKGGPTKSATMQVFEWLFSPEGETNLKRLGFKLIPSKWNIELFWKKLCAENSSRGMEEYHLIEERLAEESYYLLEEDFAGMIASYIDLLDVEGPEKMRKTLKSFRLNSSEMFPTLSDVISGMLLAEKDPILQLHKGVKILNKLMEADWDDIFHPAFTYAVDYARPVGSRRQRKGFPDVTLFGPISLERFPEFRPYAEAKAENSQRVRSAIEKAKWGITNHGLKMAWLETGFIGAPGALKLNESGAKVVVVFSPRFGPNGVPKFTIAGNGVKVDKVLSVLNVREPGWGGPSTGTIIGSPREGSCMTLEEVAEIVRKIL